MHSFGVPQIEKESSISGVTALIAAPKLSLNPSLTLLTSSIGMPCFSNTTSGEPATMNAVTGFAVFSASAIVSAIEKLV